MNNKMSVRRKAYSPPHLLVFFSTKTRRNEGDEDSFMASSSSCSSFLRVFVLKLILRSGVPAQ